MMAAQMVAMAGKPFFAQEFPSTLEAMRETVDSAVKALAERGWIGPAQRYYARLCLEEALVNAITHGNKSDVCKKVVLEMSDEESCCRIRVRDEGEGFCPDNVHKPPADALGGRGVYLIKCFMENVTFNQTEGCLEMVLPRQAPSKGGPSNA